MQNTVDLHTHTIKSDGTFTPNELLIEAESKGLKFISITDHETVDAYYNIDRNLFSGTIIPGVELRTSCFGIAIELLAYGFNIDKMKEIINKYHYKSTQELDKYMITLAYNQYKKRNIPIDENFIKDFDYVKFPRVSKYIQSYIEKNLSNLNLLTCLPKGKSFFRYCMTNPSSPLFLDLTTAFPSISELIASIKQTGGFVAIPHIFEYNDNAERILYNLLDNYDIDIIECFYSSFTTKQTEFLLDTAKKYNKFVSGGSDFHGSVRPDVNVGSGKNGTLYIPENYIQQWIPKLNNTF